jgi:ABC-type molybdate transport system substrate-binding protein
MDHATVPGDVERFPDLLRLVGEGGRGGHGRRTRHVRDLERRDLVAAKGPLAHHRLAIVVKRGNPKRIAAPQDLAQPGRKVYIEGLEGCQVGTAARDLLDLNDIVLKRPAVTMNGETPSLATVADFIKAGALDAAVVWDSAAGRMQGDLDVIALPAEQNVAVNIVAVLLRSARNTATALRFVSYERCQP